jgi:hypothetical protein
MKIWILLKIADTSQFLPVSTGEEETTKHSSNFYQCVLVSQRPLGSKKFAEPLNGCGFSQEPSGGPEHAPHKGHQHAD